VRHRALVSGALVATAILVLAACGSSSSKSVSTKPTTSVSAAAPSGASAAVKTASNDKFGQILVDSKGNTLYTLTNAGKAVPCTGSCLAVWPPAKAAAGDSVDMTGVTTVDANGAKQLAYLGLPLHLRGRHRTGDRERRRAQQLRRHLARRHAQRCEDVDGLVEHDQLDGRREHDEHDQRWTIRLLMLPRSSRAS
jgi:predicted lipoprotein with Yx(FWY)xxD motif